MGAANSSDDLPDAWFDAMAFHEAEATELEWATNAPRAERRAMARWRR